MSRLAGPVPVLAYVGDSSTFDPSRWAIGAASLSLAITSIVMSAMAHAASGSLLSDVSHAAVFLVGALAAALCGVLTGVAGCFSIRSCRSTCIAGSLLSVFSLGILLTQQL